MIATAAQLAELLPLIEGNDRVALDTEADSLHCYREKLCLLQIGLPEGDFVVDPLAANDLSRLVSLLTSKEIVLHGADYDLRLLRRGLNFQPVRLFDTMIATRLLGQREFSYAALVENFFGVQLTKGSQKANWALRPLSPQMEKYARNDTHYLLPLAEKLEAELVARHRLEWFRQLCARAIELAATDRERDGDEAWRIRGSGLIHGQQAAILRAVWYWRDKEAERADRPAFHILRNDQLLHVARTAAPGANFAFRHFSERRTRTFNAALAGAFALDQTGWPDTERRRGVRPSPEVLRRSDELRARRDEVATKLGIEASFIAPRAVIDAIAQEARRAEALLVPWQRELLGV
ncbi:MAG: ribonuclease D [Chthoniobacterales bacterium]